MNFWKTIFTAALLMALFAMLSAVAKAGDTKSDAAKTAAAKTEDAKTEDAKGKDAPAASAAADSATHNTTYTSDARLGGEKRFRENCARCHAAPPKFPPRMMATIVRHMRVRATITDEDMRLILRYMTQ